MIGPFREGGPFDMTIQGKDTVIVNNIIIGEVWLCSGQSNMQIPMRRIAVLYEEEIASSKNDFIRQFTAKGRG